MSVQDFSTILTSRIVNNQAISLEIPNTNFSLRLLGSTMPTNVDVIQVGENGVPQIVMYPKPGEDGLVALCIRILRGQNADYVPCFFRVVWKEKEGTKYPFIYLKESWVSPERIGHAAQSSIDVTIKGKRFSSFKRNGEDAPIYVPDGNLLCRYLWGTASALDVLHVAVQKKVGPITAKRVEQLGHEVQAVTQELNLNRQRMEDLKTKLSFYLNANGEYVQQVEDLQVTTMGLRNAIMPISDWFGRLPTWMQPKSVRDLIKVASGK